MGGGGSPSAPLSVANGICNIEQAPYCAADAVEEANGGGAPSTVAKKTKVGVRGGCGGVAMVAGNR
jgi:hypothetical protein